MEVFDVNVCTDNLIDLKSENQMESLLEKIKESVEIMVRWEDEDDDENAVKKSKILMTDSLMSKIKDGRFVLTSTTPEPQEE